MRWLVALLLLGVRPLGSQDPVDFQGWMNRGVAAFQDAEYPKAVAAFQRAAQIRPEDVSAHLYLGTTYMQQYIPGAEAPERLAMAVLAKDQFQRVLKLDGNNTVALASMGSLALMEKKWDHAQKWYEALVAVDPNHADAYYSMGFIAWSKWYPAYGAARAGAGMKQEEAGPIQDVAVREKLKGDYGAVIEGGLKALEKAIEIDPQYEDAMAYMNLLIRERADLRDTAEEYRRDIEIADEWVRKALEMKKSGAPPAG